MRRYVIAGGILLSSLVACQLTATVSAVVLLVETPNVLDTIDDPGLKIALALVMASEEFDTVQQAVLGLGTVIDRESATSKDFKAINNATIRLSWLGDESGNATFCREESADGAYVASDITDDTCPSGASIEYHDETAYRADVTAEGDNYDISFVAPAPVVRNLVDMTPSFNTLSLTDPLSGINLNVPTHPRDTALTVDWDADSATEGRDAFLTVVRVDYAGNVADASDFVNGANWSPDEANPIFDTFPRETDEIIDLILNAQTERSATVPADVFSETGLYLLVLTTTELSTSTSNNLFAASGAMAGAGVAWSFFVE
jgi:hypothetical protein